jgi:membrane dipeptidase
MQNGTAPLFERYLNFYKSLNIKKVLNYNDLMKCVKGDEVGGILTVENLGFVEGNINYINKLAQEGVKIASLVWNNENALAYPNYNCDGKEPDIFKRENRSLKFLGERVVELLDFNKIIVDVSHLSDGGLVELLITRSVPTIATHSNCTFVNNVSRNLTDFQIKKIADSGGVIGVNFSPTFLGTGDSFENVLKNIRHMLNIGGSGVISLGSDFDGIKPSESLKNCTYMPKLLNFLHDKLGGEIVDNLCVNNFARVFKSVCG